MHNIFANASNLKLDSDGWIAFWQNIYELENQWPDSVGQLLGLFLDIGKTFINRVYYCVILLTLERLN